MSGRQCRPLSFSVSRGPSRLSSFLPCSCFRGSNFEHSNFRGRAFFIFDRQASACRHPCRVPCVLTQILDCNHVSAPLLFSYYSTTIIVQCLSNSNCSGLRSGGKSSEKRSDSENLERTSGISPDLLVSNSICFRVRLIRN